MQRRPVDLRMPWWWWVGLFAAPAVLLTHEWAAGLLGAFLGGYGFGRDYGWRRREIVEDAHADSARTARIRRGLERFRGLPNTPQTRAMIREHLEAALDDEWRRVHDRRHRNE